MKAKRSWLNLLSLSVQLNDQDFKNQQNVLGRVAYVYPKYYFGVTIPVGLFFTMGADIKKERENVAIRAAITRNNWHVPFAFDLVCIKIRPVQLPMGTSPDGPEPTSSTTKRALRRQVEKNFQEGLPSTSNNITSPTRSTAKT